MLDTLDVKRAGGRTNVVILGFRRADALFWCSVRPQWRICAPCIQHGAHNYGRDVSAN